MGWIAEVLVILLYSRRTMGALILGVVSFFAISIIGDHQTANFELHGAMAPFAEVFKDKILSRYDKAAIGCLVASLGMAIKFYRKDRKKFYRSF